MALQLVVLTLHGCVLTLRGFVVTLGRGNPACGAQHRCSWRQHTTPAQVGTSSKRLHPFMMAALRVYRSQQAAGWAVGWFEYAQQLLVPRVAAGCNVWHLGAYEPRPAFAVATNAGVLVAVACTLSDHVWLCVGFDKSAQLPG